LKLPDGKDSLASRRFQSLFLWIRRRRLIALSRISARDTREPLAIDMMDVLSTYAELIAFGIILGTMYALVAIGLSLIFGVCGIVNVAHGDLVMLGAFVTYGAWNFLGVNPLLTLPISMALLFAVGTAVGHFLVRSVALKGLMPPMMLTFGLSLAIWNTAEVLFTPTFRTVDYLGEPVTFGFITASISYFVAFGVGLALLLIFFLMLRFSAFGKAIRAIAQNRDLAQACGINVKRIEAMTFGLGAALAGACGTMVAMVWTIYPQMGLTYLSKAFAMVVIGGLGSLPGAFLGAYIFGIAESVGTQLMSTRMAQVLPFAIIVIILALRRRGLLTAAEQE
jgi:branched-chain amino acid transport system permease protein